MNFQATTLLTHTARVPLGHASLLAALSTQPTLDVRSLVIAVNGPHSKAAAIVRRILGGLQDAA